MRKSEREVKDFKLVEALLQRAEYIHLAMWDGESPYVVPVSFGYRDRVLYFHGSFEGRKAECLRGCDRVGFDAVVEYEVSRKAAACGYTAFFKSVSGRGRATVVTDPAEKVRALDLIMGHYDGPTGQYDAKVLEATCVVRVDVEELTGKANPPWQGDAVLEVDDDSMTGAGETVTPAD